MTAHVEQAARKLVERFLRLMEARDLDAAEAMMSPDARIVFPGGNVYANQREMVAYARTRYQQIKKTFDAIDTVTVGDTVVVYIRGTLYGVNNHGVSFGNIRYIDRFEVCDGLIVAQEVWNDLAESGVLNRKAETT